MTRSNVQKCDRGLRIMLHGSPHLTNPFLDRMKKKDRKIFVLDTSVILYDHSAIASFQEHDVAIPIQVLEELDTFKKGNDSKNFEAREFIRQLDSIAQNDLLTDWVPLNGPSKGHFKVVAKHDLNGVDATKVFQDGKNDHQIINAALTLQRQNKDRKVVLVSKDIALRLKAGIARNIWGDGGYYRVLLSDDNIYDRARQALRTGPGAAAQ